MRLLARATVFKKPLAQNKSLTVISNDFGKKFRNPIFLFVLDCNTAR